MQPAEIVLRLVDAAEGQELNRDFRGKDYATNVLTFVYDEMPPGRTPIETAWVAGEKSEAKMWADIREAISLGQQAFVVCPLIEESDKLQVASAEDTFKLLAKTELKGLKLGLLHGRMSSSEKDETMSEFRDRKLDVLVATTVIEVGVDVPNATCMVVLDADRFGIADLMFG